MKPRQPRIVLISMTRARALSAPQPPEDRGSDERRERRRDLALSVPLVVQVLAMVVLRPRAEMHADAGPARTTIVAVALLAIATNALRLVVATSVLPVLALVNFGYAVAIAWVILIAVFGPGRVTVHRIQGAIVLYLDLALMFTEVYAELQFFFPNAFAGHVRAPFGTLLYFSLATLTSAAYGDFVPLHPLARSFANLEAVIGQMFPATLLARLVGLHLSHAADAREKSGTPSDRD